MVPDYWVLEDQAAHFLDPRYYRPTVPRRYLTLGAPFTWSLRPTDAAFPEKLADHQQTLDIARGRLTSRYRVGDARLPVETIILPDESVIAYHVTADAADAVRDLRRSPRRTWPRRATPRTRGTSRPATATRRRVRAGR